MTSYDFENPVEEAKRIVLNISNKASTPCGVAIKIRTDHVNMWADLWKTDITIIPKDGITESESLDVNNTKRLLRYCLYNIYSCVREHVNTEVNPLNLSVIDINGQVAYDGDIWLIPLLLMIKPDVARSLIEFRYNIINIARQLAAGYGYKGTKFPYCNDTIGYKNTLYYDVAGPMAVFNTALVSMSTWNYFRISKDRDWLLSKGYPILKGNAEFLVSRIDVDDDGTYHLRNVVDMAGNENTDENTFTNNVVRLALKFAVEASYELNYSPKDAWLNCYYFLPILFYPNTTPPYIPLLKYFADSIDTDIYTILEPLVCLVPYYYSQIFQVNSVTDFVKKNFDFYSTRIDNTYVTHPYNIVCQGIMNSLYAQYDPNFINTFKTFFDTFASTFVQGVWGNFSKAYGQGNDIVLNALCLFMVVQGIAQLNIQGGVADTRFYYEELKLNALTTANMPSTWKNIKISGTGEDLKTWIITNSIFYVGFPCGP